jgi:hypothetical protein
MTDSVEKKAEKKLPRNPGTRLSDWLRERLRDEAYRRSKVTGREPSWADLLDEAWGALEGAGNDDAAVVRTDDIHRSVVKTPKDVRGLSDSERDAVNKLLHIFRDGPRQARDALSQNLTAFALLTDFSQGVPHGGIGSISEPQNNNQEPSQATDDETRTIERNLARVKDLRDKDAGSRKRVAGGLRKLPPAAGGGR